MATSIGVMEGQGALERAVERARNRWPGIGCGPSELATYIQGLDGVPDIHRFGDELHLACACCHFDTAALRILDREYVRRCASTLARLGTGADFHEEALQELRHKLLLPPETRLAQYAGTGPLLGWLRMVLLRLGLDMKRSVQRPRNGDLADALAEQAPVDVIDAERYREAIGMAIRRVFLQLRPEDRNLLRLHHIEGLSLDQLATMQGVHRATIARWLAALRQRVFDETQGEVAIEHRLSKSEFRSVFRHVQSSLDAWNILLESTELTP
jgi:RNA polymerase sigma-70 factor (ECF subfamily)